MARWHVVRQGECLSSIAAKYGLDWKTLYDHEQNAELREKRPNPNLLLPGDRVFIPKLKPKTFIAETGKENTFVVDRPKTFLRIRLEDEEWRPLAGKRFVLKVARMTHEGTTDRDGLLCVTIPEDVQEGELTAFVEQGNVTKPCVWKLKIGHLDPIDEMSGIQARLNNLGIPCPVDGQAGEETQHALRTFQKRVGVECTGNALQTTLTELLKQHDGE